MYKRQRGKILDRNGLVLATSLPVKAIWAVPEDVPNNVPGEDMMKLAKLLGMNSSVKLLGVLTTGLLFSTHSDRISYNVNVVMVLNVRMTKLHLLLRSSLLLLVIAIPLLPLDIVVRMVMDPLSMVFRLVEVVNLLLPALLPILVLPIAIIPMVPTGLTSLLIPMPNLRPTLQLA